MPLYSPAHTGLTQEEAAPKAPTPPKKRKAKTTEEQPVANQPDSPAVG